MHCSNCGAENAKPRSYDLDLPTVVLCAMCSVLLVTDMEMFEDVGKRHATG